MSYLTLTQLHQILVCIDRRFEIADENLDTASMMREVFLSGKLRAFGFKGNSAEVEEIKKEFWQEGMLDILSIMWPQKQGVVNAFPTHEVSNSPFGQENAWSNIFVPRVEVLNLFREGYWLPSLVRGRSAGSIAFWYGNYMDDDQYENFYLPGYLEEESSDFPIFWTLCQTLTWIAYSVVMDTDRYGDDLFDIVLGVIEKEEPNAIMQAAESELLNKLTSRKIVALGVPEDSTTHENIPVEYLINKRLEFYTYKNVFGGGDGGDYVYDEARYPEWKEVKFEASKVLDFWGGRKSAKKFTGKDESPEQSKLIEEYPEKHQRWIKLAINFVDSKSNDELKKITHNIGGAQQLNQSLVASRISSKNHILAKDETVRRLLNESKHLWDTVFMHGRQKNKI